MDRWKTIERKVVGCMKSVRENGDSRGEGHR